MGDFGCSLFVLFLAFGVLKCVRAFKSRVLRDALRKDECFTEERDDGDEFHEVKERFEDECFMEERDDGDGDEFQFQFQFQFDGGIEDEETNVTALREIVKAERRRGDAALRDLDKERMAAASSAEEAMSMIFRLQNDKSSLQIQLNQLRRSVEEKQLYDQELIHSLQWTLMQYEDATNPMEDELELSNNRFNNFTAPYLGGCKLQDLRIASLD